MICSKCGTELPAKDSACPTCKGVTLVPEPARLTITGHPVGIIIEGPPDHPLVAASTTALRQEAGHAPKSTQMVLTVSSCLALLNAAGQASLASSLTIDELLKGGRIDYPRTAGSNVTFKKAPNAKRKDSVQLGLDRDG
jgi:hypothetical protein